MRYGETLRRRLVYALVGLFLLPAVAPAQDDTVGLSESISVGYVIIPFVAIDQYGRPISNLRPRDVEVHVEGATVETDFFERTRNAPVSFTILIDGSGSMALAGKLDGARDAVRALLSRRVEGDDYSLHVFAEGEVVEVVPFTEEGYVILQAIGRIEPWGKTALFDALMRIPDRTILGRNGSRAIILLTDGLDNASDISRGDLSNVFQGVEVPVYPLGLRSGSMSPRYDDNPEAAMDLAVLSGLAGLSGGRLAIAETRRELHSAIKGILDELRSQYLIGFAPSGRGAIRYRTISLRFARPVKTVLVRAGYRGTEPPILKPKSR